MTDKQCHTLCGLGDRAPEPEEELPESYWEPFRQSAVDTWNRRAALAEPVGGVSKPLSPDTRDVLAAIDCYGAPREAVAQGFRALAFLRPGGPITNEQLIRIAEELDP